MNAPEADRDRPWSAGSRSCRAWTSPSAASRRTAAPGSPSTTPTIDARVSTLPSLHGEKVVIRLLTRGDDVPPLDGARLRAAPARAVPLGAVGAAGAGADHRPDRFGQDEHPVLGDRARSATPDKNIVTLEDPVEVQLPGITQVGVNEKTGMTFSTRACGRSCARTPTSSSSARSATRETAELALKASLTGHLVLTTLHTNSAVAALTRLVDMGVEPFLVASSLTAAVAQRLVRRPCPTCAAPYQPGRRDAAPLLGLTHRRPRRRHARPRGAGCPECGGTGYRGRTAVYEVLDVDAAMRQVLLKDATEASSPPRPGPRA